MISVSEARNIIHAHTVTFPDIQLGIEEAYGKVLRKPLMADRDFPPFDRVSMDGVAINFEKNHNGGKFLIESTQYAGSSPLTLKNPVNCIEVMTGAMLPNGTDTVIPYENIAITYENHSRLAGIDPKKVKYGQNIQRKGLEQQKGNTLVPEGFKLGASEIAVAASVGRQTLTVAKPPSVAIVATGNELVNVDETPEPYQIRMSNTYALENALKANHIFAEQFHIRDEKQELTEKLKSILHQYDVVILSGGVSMGKADLVPEVLDELGVKTLFHKVAQKPGKPFWFGNNKEGKTVFALPGNPVSAFVCFYQYILPWFNSSLQAKPQKPLMAKLDREIRFGKELTYFLPVSVFTDHNGFFIAEPFEGKGSGDFVNLLKVDGFMELPPDKEKFYAGEVHYLTLFRCL